jgi:hypothetical protein
MKISVITVAASVLSLAAGKVFAFGYPGMQPSVYAAHAFPNEPYHTGTVFSEILCRHTKSGPAAAHNATPGVTADPLAQSAPGHFQPSAGRSH